MAFGETLKGQNLPVIPRYPGWPKVFVFVPGHWDPSLSSGRDSFPVLVSLSYPAVGNVGCLI